MRTEFNVTTGKTTEHEDALVTPQIPPTYQELRAAKFNLKTTGEQFGMIYDDMKNGTTTWIDWQDVIKTEIPKV